MNISKAKRMLFDIALSSGATETEYDGRMYTFCYYCGSNLEYDKHDEDCEIYQARRILGSDWDEYIEKQQKEQETRERAEEIKQRKEAEREAKLEAKRAYEKEKLPCSKCGKKVSRIGMEQHMKSQACEKQRLKNQYSEDENVKRCSHCKTPMPGAHPSKKFCSNKGPGNCKDRFNNLRGGRRDRMTDFNRNRYDNDLQDSFDHSCDIMGRHYVHKDEFK